jgi:acid phosphatase (class A)
MQTLLALFITLITTTAFAQHFELSTKILTPAQVEKIIGAFPKKGSAAEAADYKTLLDYQTTRTAEDCALAAQDVDTSVRAMFGGDNGILSKDEVKKMDKFLKKAWTAAGVNSYMAKRIYKRERPYDANNKIKPCIELESSYAYPSGHTLLARLYARILSQVYPERAEKIMARSNQYAMNRVLGGVHHPSDVEASFILGDYLATEMMDVDDFVGVE